MVSLLPHGPHSVHPNQILHFAAFPCHLRCAPRLCPWSPPSSLSASSHSAIFSVNLAFIFTAMRMTPSSTCPVNPTPLCHLPPSPTASQKLNLGSSLTSLNLTTLKSTLSKVNSFSLTINSSTVSPRPSG